MSFFLYLPVFPITNKKLVSSSTVNLSWKAMSPISSSALLLAARSCVGIFLNTTIASLNAFEGVGVVVVGAVFYEVVVEACAVANMFVLCWCILRLLLRVVLFLQLWLPGLLLLFVDDVVGNVVHAAGLPL